MGDPPIPALSHSQRLHVTASSRAKRLSKTRKLEKLILEDPLRVKEFRKHIDRNSGKFLFKLAKIKIVRNTDNMYITDKAKVFRKSHISLRPNFNVHEFSATPGKIGEKLQRRTILRPATQKSTSPASTQTSEPVRGGGPHCGVIK